MIRRLVNRQGLWLALSVLAGVGLVATGLATTGDLVAQVWGGVVLVLAAGLLRARPDSGKGDKGKDDAEAPTS